VFSGQITAGLLLGLLLAPAAASAQTTAQRTNLPRTADGKPDLAGIWQVRNTAASDLLDHAATLHLRAGTSVVAGNDIPYQPPAAAQRLENLRNRATADPLAQCFMPGVPRIMYLDFPFQIFQTPQLIAMTFEWSSVHRQIYTDGSSHVDGIDFWMGDSRGRWEGDTLVVDVTNHNDKTWFDAAGNFHSEALKLVERYTLLDADTIEYEVTVEDPKVFTRPWKMSMPFHRQTGLNRILEYQCQAEVEEANGAFPRLPVTWYQEPGAPPSPLAAATLIPFDPQHSVRPTPAVNSAAIRRRPDGKPDLQGTWVSDTGGANQGLERRERVGLSPASRGIIVDPADGKLPTQAWAKAEHESRERPERGYDDPTAHCFAAGVPRSMYVPQPYYIMQTDTHVVLLFERMSWRIVPTDGRGHLPDRIRLWQGDSVGRWDGDTLVVETTNLNGKTWLNEAGEIVSHAETVVERLTPVDADTLHYEATVTDPIVYTRPWTIAFPVKRQTFELLEVACHEDDQDLPRLKAIKNAAGI
jgi:hypothetical protein